MVNFPSKKNNRACSSIRKGRVSDNTTNGKENTVDISVTGIPVGRIKLEFFCFLEELGHFQQGILTASLTCGNNIINIM